MEIITDMEAWREQATESLGGSGFVLQPQGPDGESFVVPHPLLVTDEQSKALEGSTGSIEIAKALLNSEDDPDRHGRFIAAGGRSGDVLLCWRQMTEKVDIGPKLARP